MKSRIGSKNELRAAVTVLVSFLLVSCGGSSGSDENANASDANTADTNTTIDTPTDANVADTNTTADTSMDVNSVDTTDQTDELAVLQPTNDITTGGYVGSSGPLRSTIALPENGAGYNFGLVDTPVRFAVFGSFDTNRRLQEFMSDFTRPLDSCHHVGLTPFNGFGENFTVPFGGFTFVGAGDALPVLGPNGSLGELTRNSTIYSGSFSSQSFSSSEISISIPGDEFPAYDTNTFPEADELTGFRSTDSTLFDFRNSFNLSQIQTVLWDPSNDPEAFIHLEFFADTSEEAIGTFHCTLEDDGEFTFPQEIIELYTGVAAAELRLVARVKVKQLTQDDSTLLLVDVKEQ